VAKLDCTSIIGLGRKIPPRWAQASKNNYTEENPESSSTFSFIHCKKVPVPLPAPSRDVTDQTLSSQECVSFLKPGVFPDISFPILEFHRILLNRRSFPGYSSSTALTSSKIFANSFVWTCSQPGVFPDFPLPQKRILTRAFGQPSPILINCVWGTFIHIETKTIGPSLKHEFASCLTI
jgi:hypothetical protein